MNHVTIKARKLSVEKAFVPKRFDLGEKPRPKEIRHISGYWLFVAIGRWFLSLLRPAKGATVQLKRQVT